MTRKGVSFISVKVTFSTKVPWLQTGAVRPLSASAAACSEPALSSLAAPLPPEEGTGHRWGRASPAPAAPGRQQTPETPLLPRGLLCPRQAPPAPSAWRWGQQGPFSNRFFQQEPRQQSQALVSGLFLIRCSKPKVSSRPQKEATDKAVPAAARVILDSSVVPPDIPERNQLMQATEPGLGETASARGPVAAPQEASGDPHLQELTDHRDILLRH